MDFFRRFQKPILIATSVLVMGSFVFYGVFSVVSSTNHDATVVKEKVNLFKTAKGRKITKDEVAVFEQVLDSAFFTHRSPLLDHQGAFADQWVENKMVLEILRPHAASLQGVLKEKIEVVKNDRGYVHPYAPYISQFRAFSLMSKEFPALLQEIRSAPEVNAAVIENFFDLFMRSSSLPADLIRSLLVYEQQKLPASQHDLSLPYRNLSLFGWKKLSDWIGNEGVMLLAQAFEHVYDTACSSRYKMTSKEVQKRFFQVGTRANEEVIRDHETLLEYLKKEGIAEEEFWKFWNKWFVIEDWMQFIRSQIVFDPTHVSTSFADILTDINAEIYEVPKEFRFHEPLQMLEFQVYLESIAANDPLREEQGKQSNLDLPQQFLSPKEIKKKSPEFVQSTVAVQLQKWEKSQVPCSLRKIWAWQSSELGWNRLKQEFPFLQKEDAQNALSVIKTLPPDLRKKIDQFSTEQATVEMLQELPADEMSWEKDKLCLWKSQEEKTAQVYLKNERFENEALLKFLQQCAVDSEIVIQHRSHFYRFKIVAPKVETILSFTEANQRKVTRKALDHLLEKEYRTLVKSGSAMVKGEKGDNIPLEDCRLKVAEAAFNSFFSALQTVANSSHEEASSLPLSSTELCSFRFVPFLEQVKKELTSTDSNSRKIRARNTTEDEQDLARQWALFSRCEHIPLAELDPSVAYMQGNEIVLWNGNFILLKNNGSEQNPQRLESKVVEMKKALEQRHLQQTLSDLFKSGDFCESAK